MNKTYLRDNFRFSATGFLHAFLVYLFLLLFFAAIRLALLSFFNGPEEISGETADLLKAFFVGFRFDTMVICYGLFPMVVLNIAGIFMSGRGERYFSFLGRVSGTYYAVLVVFVLCVSIVDLYYFNFFQTHIDVRLYGIIDDDTVAVAQSIWKDYPVLLITVGLVAGGFGAHRLAVLIRKVRLPEFRLPLPAWWAALVVALFLFSSGVRGSLFGSTVRNSDAYVSKHLFINQIAPNGVYALKATLRGNNKECININTDKAMARWGFDSPCDAVGAYVGREVEGDANSLKREMTGHTPADPFLEENPPNVVFILMESMSAHFLALHDRENFNLLGKLEDVLPECLLFTHFLSAGNATIYTLEGILVNSPMTPLCQSPYMDISLGTSVALPFKKKGYRTSFVTGGNLAWRSLDKFIPHQYIDNIEGSAHIKELYPGALSNKWGCYDEYMFADIYDLLAQADNDPQFVFGLTVTNHTPHSIPETYEPYPINMPGGIKHKLSADEEQIRMSLLTYQYASNFLGKFIDDIRNSPLGENTIIVATGDHAARRTLDYPDCDMLQQYAVPLIMYVPEKYRQRIEAPDTKAFASHKDIFPTLYNLALSDAAYVKSGINLFDKEALAGNFAISGYKVVMNGQGCVFVGDENVYYVWADEEKNVLKPADKDGIRQLKNVVRQGKAYSASMTYLIQKELTDCTEKITAGRRVENKQPGNNPK